MYQSSIFLPAFLVTEETKGGKAKSNEKGVKAVENELETCTLASSDYKTLVAFYFL